MFELLEKLREKPDHKKKQIAFLLSLFIVGIIFVIWLSVIYPDFKNESLIDDKVSKLEPSPLGTFSETFKTGISAIGEQVTKLKESVSNIATDLASSSIATSTSEQ
jgi:cytoskeletal protein RodZ